MNISNEAVEAALQAWAVRGGLSPKSIVRNILEAAAPHLMAQAWDEGVEAGYRSRMFGLIRPAVNPYRAAGAGEPEYPAYPNDRVRDMVIALDEGRQPS